MIMEYMSHGDLLGFLRASRGHYGMYTVNPGIRNHQPPNLQLSSRDLLSIGAKVANGMRFLADRKVCIYNLTRGLANMYVDYISNHTYVSYHSLPLPLPLSSILSLSLSLRWSIEHCVARIFLLALVWILR